MHVLVHVWERPREIKVTSVTSDDDKEKRKEEKNVGLQKSDRSFMNGIGFVEKSNAK